MVSWIFFSVFPLCIEGMKIYFGTAKKSFIFNGLLVYSTYTYHCNLAKICMGLHMSAIKVCKVCVSYIDEHFAINADSASLYVACV